MTHKKTELMQEVETRFEQPLERTLLTMLNNPELNLQEIIDQLGVTQATLGYWLLKLGITVRKVALAPGETLEIKRAS